MSVAAFQPRMLAPVSAFSCSFSPSSMCAPTPLFFAASPLSTSVAAPLGRVAMSMPSTSLLHGEFKDVQQVLRAGTYFDLLNGVEEDGRKRSAVLRCSFVHLFQCCLSSPLSFELAALVLVRVRQSRVRFRLCAWQSLLYLGGLW
jgi:hypothetical protein